MIGGALAQQGLTPVLRTQTKSGVSEADYVDLLLQQQVSGVVFAGGLFAQADEAHEHDHRLAERRIPVVLINAPIEGLDFPCVTCDDAVAIDRARRHLASLGHERIGVVMGPSDHAPSRRKLTAARSVAAATGGQPAEEYVERAMFSLEGGQAAASRLLERGVTGVIRAGDPLALGAVRAARRRGLRVPSEIPVVGYDDSAFMNCTAPAHQDPPAHRGHGPGRRRTALRGYPGRVGPPGRAAVRPGAGGSGLDREGAPLIRGSRRRRCCGTVGTWTTSTHSPRNT